MCMRPDDFWQGAWRKDPSTATVEGAQRKLEAIQEAPAGATVMHRWAARQELNESRIPLDHRTHRTREGLGRKSELDPEQIDQRFRVRACNHRTRCEDRDLRRPGCGPAVDRAFFRFVAIVHRTSIAGRRSVLRIIRSPTKALMTA